MGQARPCPWVGCRHHLLLEVTRSGGLSLNRPSSGSKRKALGSSEATRSGPRNPQEIVDLWIDEAAEALSQMGDTCSLDVADRVFLERVVLGNRTMGRLLGMTPQGALFAIKSAEVALEHTGVSLRHLVDPNAED